MSKIAQKLNILFRSGQTIFSTNELMLFWGVENKKTLYTQIARMKEKQFLETVQRGLYILVGSKTNEFELASSLKKNSYISFETVLVQNDIINQWYGTYFSASDRKANIKNKYGNFSYRRLADKILNNRLGIRYKQNYFIASTERAICDYFYVFGFQQLDNIEDIDKKELVRISKIYGNQRLEKDIFKLIELI